MKLKITVDAKLYEVDVEIFEPEQLQPSYHAPLAKPSAPSSGGSAPVADEGKVCRSPFSGTVSKVTAQAGQTILVNDVLLVLEAMKMETVITAPIAGKVAKVNVNVGDAVQQGQVLVEFD